MFLEELFWSLFKCSPEGTSRNSLSPRDLYMSGSNRSCNKNHSCIFFSSEGFVFVFPKISKASDLKDAKYFKIQTSLFHRTFSLINFQKENFCLLKLSLNIFLGAQIHAKAQPQIKLHSNCKGPGKGKLLKPSKVQSSKAKIATINKN